MPGLVLNSATAISPPPYGTSGSFSGRASLTMDTRGATAIFVFVYAAGNADGIPVDGRDSEGNTWDDAGNPFSTCSGSTGSARCFFPKTSATHNFRAVGPSFNFAGHLYTVQLIVIALIPTLTGNFYLTTREASNQAESAHPGAFTTPFNDYAMIASCMAGCGFTNALAVDSGFTIVQQLDNIAVATCVKPTIGLVDVAWSGFAIPFSPDNPLNRPTAGVIIDGFGIYTGQSPSGTSNTRIYEA